MVAGGTSQLFRVFFHAGFCGFARFKSSLNIAKIGEDEAKHPSTPTENDD